MLSSQTTAEITKALVAVQRDLKIAIKDKANPFFKSKYADLQTVWETCRQLLAQNGIAVVQSPGGSGEVVSVQTTLLHTSGEWLSDHGLAMRPAKTDPQGVASCITYARRYGLMAVVGIVSDEDDDGEASVGRGAPERAKPAVRELRDEPRPAQSQKPTTHEVGDAATVAILAGLTTIKAQGGWNHAAHKQAWKAKHQPQVDSLDMEDRLEVSKFYTSIGIKGANGNG